MKRGTCSLLSLTLFGRGSLRENAGRALRQAQDDPKIAWASHCLARIDSRQVDVGLLSYMVTVTVEGKQCPRKLTEGRDDG